jgi:ribosomal protein S12 methylthiotransferase accessory factor
MQRIEPFLRPFGVTRLARLTDLDNVGIPVWNAVVPNSKSIVINQGKGITDIDAKVSAAMEALERAVACQPFVESRRCSRSDLSSAGHRSETLLSLIAAGREDVADDEMLEWTRGTDLSTGEAIFIPYEALLLDRTRCNVRFWQSSDGLASGNTDGEAILHALLERIERDAYVLWQVSPDVEPVALDPRSFANPVIEALAGRVHRAGLSLRLFDITSDIGIPSYSAFIAPRDIGDRRHARFVDATHGCGTHPNPMRAAIRAITEAAQSRLTFISGARDDIFPEAFERPLPDQTRRLFLSKETLIEVPTVTLPPDARGLLTFALDKAVSANITTIVAVKLSSMKLPFSVVKVLVPQLENPDGARKRRFGYRAISRALEVR